MIISALDKVIIKGTNFGTDPEAIKVYYNTKKGKSHHNNVVFL